jgi:hypothetical protein
VSSTEITPHLEMASPRAAAKRDRTTAWLILIAMMLSVVMSHATMQGVWHKNTFFDTDDAMQLVEVRNFLKGQNWFDLTAARLDPPYGVFMHWSRLVDAPLALLIKTFGLFMPSDPAERLARIVFPLVLQALLFLGVARLARRLIGVDAILPAIVLTLFSGMMLGQFQPGRINHSATQIVLSVFMLGSFIEALDPARARQMAVAGALAALSLAISLENLPWIGLLSVLLVAFWIARGGTMRTALLSFGLGLAAALPIAFFSTIGPARWFDEACDAYSFAYFIPGLAGAAALLILGFVSPSLKSSRARLAAALIGAGGVAVAIAFTKPICFLDPYNGIDPLVREIWLKNVEEALPLRRFFAMRPATAVIFALPVLLGFVASVAACVFEKGLGRLRWITVAALAGAGSLMCFWQIRIFGFVSPFALMGGAWSIIKLRDRLAKTRWREFASLAFILALPFSSIGWALAAPAPSSPKHDPRDVCLATSSFAPLAQLPPGLVAGPIDAGSYILALTPHSVLAAPYHRDNHGNRIVLDALLSSPEAAREILRANHVAYVVNCAGLNETKTLAERAPYSLAAQLYARTPPAWLSPVPHGGPLQVFVMRP